MIIILIEMNISIYMQYILLISFVIYLIVSNINFMDTYSEKVIQEFNENRKIRIVITLLFLFFLYLCGSFDKIF